MTYLPSKFEQQQTLGDLANFSSDTPANLEVVAWSAIDMLYKPVPASTTHTHPLGQLSDVQVLQNTQTAYANLNSTANLLYRYRAEDAIESGGIVTSWPAEFCTTMDCGFIVNNNNVVKTVNSKGIIGVRANQQGSPANQSAIKISLGGTLVGKTYFIVLSNLSNIPVGIGNGTYGLVTGFSNSNTSGQGIIWTTDPVNNNIKLGGSYILNSFISNNPDTVGILAVTSVSNTNVSWQYFTGGAFVSNGPILLDPINTVVDRFKIQGEGGGGGIGITIHEILVINEIYTEAQQNNIISALNEKYNQIPLAAQANRVLKSNQDGNLYTLDRVKLNEMEGSLNSLALGAGTGVATVELKMNYTGTVAPTVTDDNTAGYRTGSIWIDTNAGNAYICITAGTGTAVWKQISV